MNNFKSRLDTLATLLVIIAASALLWRLFQPPPTFPGQLPPVETVTDQTIPSGSITHARGSGPVALVEFSDFECPFCARHAQTTAPAIKDKLLDSGMIRQVFFNFPLAIHPRAQAASEAAECAAQQGRFWDMHESLFANPTALEVADLVSRAARLGLDAGAFTRCLETGETAERVADDLAAGRRLAVTATPVFFVGLVQADGSITLVRRINGALSPEEFDAVFEEVFEDVLPKHRARRGDGLLPPSPRGTREGPVSIPARYPVVTASLGSLNTFDQ